MTRNHYDPSPQLRELVDLACTSMLTDVQHRELEQLLVADQNNCDLYLQYCRMHAEISLHVHANDAVEAAMRIAKQRQYAGERLLASDDSDQDSDRSVSPASRRGAFWQPLRQLVGNGLTATRRLARHDVSKGVAVAVAVLMAVLVWAYHIEVGQLATDQQQERPGETAANQSTYVATLTGRYQLVWQDDAHPQGVRPRLKKEQRLVLASGIVEITFDDGALALIEGPAEFEVSSGARGRLELGRLVARAPSDETKGLIIDTPHASVEDLGTEFGIEVRRDGVADVVVLEGEVVCSREAFGNTPATRVNLTEGQAASIQAGSGGITKHAQANAQLLVAFRQQIESPIQKEAVPEKPVEPAEAVAAAGQYQWDGGENGRGTLWSDALNWDPDGPINSQAASNTVSVGAGFSTTIDVNTGSTANGRNWKLGGVTIAGSAAHETHTIAEGGILHTSGYVRFMGDASLKVQRGGAFNWSGELYISDGFEMIVQNGAVMDVAPDNNAHINLSGKNARLTVDAGGTVDQGDMGFLMITGASNSVKIAGPGASYRNGGTTISQGGQLVINDGTFDVTTRTRLLTLDQGSAVIRGGRLKTGNLVMKHSSGVFEIRGGVVSLTRIIFGDGASVNFSVGSAGVLYIDALDVAEVAALIRSGNITINGAAQPDTAAFEITAITSGEFAGFTELKLSRN